MRRLIIRSLPIQFIRAAIPHLRRAAEDPELFAAYRTLVADAESVVAALI